MIRKAALTAVSALLIATSISCSTLKPSENSFGNAAPVFVDVDTPSPAPTAASTPVPTGSAIETTPIATTPEVTVPAITAPAASSTPEAAENTPEATAESAAPTIEASLPPAETASPAPTAASGKIFMGKYTGTDKTYTGLEPLPLSDFNNPPMQNSENLSTKCIDHCTGTPKNGQVHDVVVSIQKEFDKRGADAVCYDNRTDEKVLYLTFDLGFENGYTNMILDTLKEKNVKTTFFCTLPEIKSNTAVMTRIIKEGHILGNHSCTHPDFSSLTRSQMYREIKDFDDYLRTHYGYSSTYFRYPMGKHSIDSTDFLNRMGYTCVFWSVAWVDYNEPKGAEVAYETIVGKLHPGAIILLHALSPDNAYALADIIDTAHSMGYEFRMLTDLRG